jgi:hypothetical protein
MYPPNLLPGRNRFTTQRVQEASYRQLSARGKTFEGQIFALSPKISRFRCGARIKEGKHGQRTSWELAPDNVFHLRLPGC